MSKVSFYDVSIHFSGSPNDHGVITGSGSHSFSTNVMEVGAAIKGWEVSFGSTDHHVKAIGADITSVQKSGTTVEVEATLQLIDNSKNKMDVNSCSMTVVLMAQCE